MFGNNPVRAPLSHKGEWLEVKEIFPTLQGEGPFVGQPGVFVRLGGCNLACSFCDTEFEKYRTLTIDEILSAVHEQSGFYENPAKVSKKLVVITGGEPLRQPIELLCQQLLACHYKVQIETNGTLYRSLPKEVFIVCSPKAISGRYYPLREDLLPHLQALKFLVAEGEKGYETVPELGQSKYNIPVYVQPMDSYDQQKNHANQQLAVKLALDKGYFLSLQTHKILNLA